MPTSSNASPVRRASARRSRLVARLSGLWALGAFLFPVVAEASDGPYYGGGFFLGCTFGEHTNFEGGVEGFANWRLDDVPEGGEGARHVAGGLLQLAWRPDAPRITLAGVGGMALSGGIVGFSQEHGGTYRFGVAPGFGIHMGVTADLAVAYSSLRHQFLLDDTWIGGGLRLPPFYGSLGVTKEEDEVQVGRPLRTDEGVLHCKQADDRKPGGERELAALHWQRAAQHECESVPAFLRLAEELLFHDAPDELVERALDAAEDEICHAVLSGLLAQALSPEARLPSMPLPEPRRLVRGESGLRQLATESLVDGLIGEGMAAERARLGSLQAKVPSFARAQRRIALDESRHAALGGAIARWAALAGGDTVRDALTDLRRREPSGGCDDSSQTDLHRYGLVGAQDANRIAERTTDSLPTQVERLLEG